jgi:hypothetical protein
MQTPHGAGRPTPAVSLVLAAVLGAALPAARSDACGTCATDVDADGQTGFADLTLLLIDWGCTTCSALDLDGSGNVGFGDVTLLLIAWGPCQFQYPPPFADAEAEQIALESLGPNGPLFASEDHYARIDQDLDAIRSAEPNLVTETHTMAWGPSVIVTLTPGVPHDEFECLNEYYQATITYHFPSFNMTVIAFPRILNAEAMAQIYLEAPEVTAAQPDSIIGGENFWTPAPSGGPSGTWLWEIDDGFMDCFDGCDCHNIYTFKTTPGAEATLLDLISFGASWCGF